jgi:hypothetical protein
LRQTERYRNKQRGGTKTDRERYREEVQRQREVQRQTEVQRRGTETDRERYRDRQRYRDEVQRQTERGIETDREEVQRQTDRERRERVKTSRRVQNIVTKYLIKFMNEINLSSFSSRRRRRRTSTTFTSFSVKLSPEKRSQRLKLFFFVTHPTKDIFDTWRNGQPQ